MFRIFRLGLIVVSLAIYVSGEDTVGNDEDTVGNDEENQSTEEGEEDEQPPYEIPIPEDVFFYETFSSELEELSWVVSDHSEGKCKVGKGTQTTGIKSEQGLILEDEAKKYAVSSKFPADFDPSDQDLVIQYEVRFHKNHECGGAYMKVLKSDQDWEPKFFKDDVEYVIMFGPDKCGSTNKVHFIFRHQHKITNEFEEKHLKKPPTIKNDRLTHLYTLVIRTDNTYEIFIDQESVNKGKLLEDFEPAVNPLKEIDDPEDHKPTDWVDEAKINDPEAFKPDDWDEDAPKEIIDESATQPSGWNEDEPFQIPDPQTEQPEDWDEEDDGEWEAPLVDNPACSVGCGKWEPPVIANPDYKGKWIHPKIDNVDYKGEWAPKQIDNPNYFEDPEPHRLHPMSGVGFELWTMQNQIEFDNIFIDNSLEKAIEFGKATWAIKYAVEKAAQDKDEGGDSFINAINYMMAPIYQFADYGCNNPMYGILFSSLIFGAFCFFIWVCVKFCCGSEEDTPQYGQGYVKREISENKVAEEEDSEDEGAPDTNNKKSEEKVEKQEVGVDKVKEKQELEEKKKQRKQNEKKKEKKKAEKKKPLKKKKSKRAD